MSQYGTYIYEPPSEITSPGRVSCTLRIGVARKVDVWNGDGRLADQEAPLCAGVDTFELRLENRRGELD